MQPRDDALRADQVAQAIREGGEGLSDAKQGQVLAIGALVRTRNLDTAGHCRLPRYARDRVGVINAFRGSQIFPDSNALGQGGNPQPVYSVAFDAAELWGPTSSCADKIYIDLWESYLEPA